VGGLTFDCLLQSETDHIDIFHSIRVGRIQMTILLAATMASGIHGRNMDSFGALEWGEVCVWERCGI